MPRPPRAKIGSGLLLTCLALGGGHAAAESLPTLRVHPGLLGSGTPLANETSSPAANATLTTAGSGQTGENFPPTARPAVEAADTRPAPAPTQPISVAPAAKATAATPTKAPTQAEAPASQATPIAPVAPMAPTTAEAPRSMPAATQASPAPAPNQSPVTPTDVPRAETVGGQSRGTGATAASGSLPSMAATSETSVTDRPEATTPPRVADRPRLPPLYSAHAAAGAIPLGDGSTRISAEKISGRNDREVVAEGDVELRRDDTALRTDRLTYWQDQAEFEAAGNVRLTKGEDSLSGPYLRLKTDTQIGYFEAPAYRIQRKPKKSEEAQARTTVGSGDAARIDFEGEGKYRLSEATYSTCQAPAGERPDWYVRANELNLDYDEEAGTAHGTTVVFGDVPILYSPWISFSLNNRRRSGLLAASIGSSSLNGAEYRQPIYWNIAPDKDATITPRLMSKRGLLIGGEFRYLAQDYSGIIEGQVLEHDKLKGTSRGSYTLTHVHAITPNLKGSLVLNGVSDDTFLSDLANSATVAAHTNLLRQGALEYAGGWWNASVLAQSYRTLQDPSLPPVAKPYQRLPQIRLAATRADLPAGLALDFVGEHVAFRHDTLVEGRRFTTYPSLSLPIQTAGWFVTPKVGVHATSYQLDRQAAGVPSRQSRTLPIASLDSGLIFERATEWFGEALTQTLEPRLFYLYVPERDQTLIPIFDSAIADFNFAQIFAENRYAGGDRIADANQATAMLSSRLLDPVTGEELLRGAIGQRFYFTTQHVGLPGEVLRTDRQTDYLAALSGRILPKTYADFGMQYNPRDSRTERLNLGVRYQPDRDHVVNAAYRYTRNVLGQIDLSAAWPILNGWSGVGRLNYSTKDKRVVESIAGLEYNAGCWAARVVAQRFATAGASSNTAIMFQLELSGFTDIGVGSNPRELLRRNIPGYGLINQPIGNSAYVPTQVQ